MQAWERDIGTELARIIAPGRVRTRYIDRIAFANDASVYRLIPRVVVLPESVGEIQSLFRFSRRTRTPMTFRAAGTSLSGQAITDGILAVLSGRWNEVTVEEGGRRVRVQPGVIGGAVNRLLKPFGAKIGPDPASIASCMLGGILANNSSGMCCGVTGNAYHTLDAMRFVLPDGLELDTEDPDADDKLRTLAPGLARGLLELKTRLERDAALASKVRAKYRLKNTMGYSLNALLDFSRPLEILSHLMIGSEGTLGFIAEAVLRTVPDYPLKYTGLLFFPDVARACSAISPLNASGARALELMDRASLRSIEDEPGLSARVRELAADAAALLVEYQCETSAELDQRRQDCSATLPKLPLLDLPEFTTIPEEQAVLWRARKGLIPSVGAMRRRGTSFIIEDVVFPVDRLARGVTDLQSLFARHGYDDAIVFGHARDGNLHFVLTQAFDGPADSERYDAFMNDLASVVVGDHGGALKAEHGTGRNMAPFVEAEWGLDAVALMRTLKALLDPDGLLNPGVILNEDPRAHVTHLKDLPAVEAEVDHCIECGFCERVCPSRELTLTPRQRIVVRREMARLREADPRGVLLGELERDFEYAGIETCATDGLCAGACPVGIDTGKLVKRLRLNARTDLAQEVAYLAATRLSWVERAARAGLETRRLLRSWGVSRWSAGIESRLLRAICGEGSLGDEDLSGAPAARGEAGRPEDVAGICLPSCVGRVLGDSRPEDGPAGTTAMLTVADRAGLPLWVPSGTEGHCCGLPFASKGLDRAYRHAVNRTVSGLWRWSDAGRLPVVLESSPCARSLRECGPALTEQNRSRHERIRILDGIGFAHDRLLPLLSPRRVPGRVVLHPVCSILGSSLEGRLERLAAACAEGVHVPPGAGCCGFAGDRGFSVPELTASATRVEAAEVASGSWSGYYSSSRTCEIALSRATGRKLRFLLVSAGANNPLKRRASPAPRDGGVGATMRPLDRGAGGPDRGMGRDRGWTGIRPPGERMRDRPNGFRLAVAVLALLVWGGLAGANEPTPLGGEVGVLGGILYADENLSGESGTLAPTLGLRGGSVFTSRLIWYIDALYGSVDSGSSLGDARMYWGRTGLEWLFVKNRRSSWFVTGGFGWVLVDYSRGTVEDFHRPLVSAGVGQRYPIGERLQLRWELRADVTVDNRPGLDGEAMTQGLALAGLIWGPSGKSGAHLDSDGDKVSDAKDFCPATPMFAYVDRRGCPQDSDGDGVPDGIDQCRGTQLGQSVDELGCLGDSDDDGVVDATDACPGTLEGVIVDDWGCAKDPDHDGIASGIDRCPRTIVGVKVDEYGCPLDGDGDGVPDGLDRCPDTPADSRIDGKGCVASNFLYVPETRTLILWLDFEVNIAELSDDGILILDEVLPVLAASDYRFEIGGHVDPAAGESDLDRLSYKRAEAVRDYLVDQGLEADRFETEGYGTAVPLNLVGAGMRSNRTRIEVTRTD